MIRMTRRTQLYFGLSVLVARLAYRLEALALLIANRGVRSVALPLPGATGHVVREYLLDDRD